MIVLKSDNNRALFNFRLHFPLIIYTLKRNHSSAIKNE